VLDCLHVVSMFSAFLPVDLYKPLKPVVVVILSILYICGLLCGSTTIYGFADVETFPGGPQTTTGTLTEGR